MEQTYLINAIVLDKQPWRETDARVFLYSKEHGVLDLVIRGARKISSRLSDKLEPFTVAEVMVISGRQFSYVGGVSVGQGFSNIRLDYDKMRAAGKLVRLYLDLIKYGSGDARLYDLGLCFFSLLDAAASRPVLARYLGLAAQVKVLMILGVMAEARFCNQCYNHLTDNGWLIRSGEFVCRSCRPTSELEGVEMGSVAIHFIQQLSQYTFEHVIKSSKLDKNALLKLELAVETVKKNQY